MNPRYLLRHFLLSICILLSIDVSAQQNESQLAFDYYRTQEFDKAAELFESLYNQTKAKVYLNYYIKSLAEIKDYKTAEKVLKREIKANPSDLSYSIDLGYIYNHQGDTEQATKTYDAVLEKIEPNQNMILMLANDFLRNQLYDYAEKTYLKGRKMINYGFNSELANVYAAQRKYGEMLNEFLEQLDADPMQTENIQTRIQYYLINDFDNNFSDIFRTTLLKKVQSSPNTFIYSEMLIWYFIQQKEFASAIIQSKALDKRTGNTGRFTNSTATVALENADYATAKEGYSYVIEKCKNPTYYKKASDGLLKVLYQQVINGEITTETEIKDIENQYLKNITENGINLESILLIRELAHLQAFYLNKTIEAISLLESAIEIPGISTEMRGTCKIELGDIKLMANEPWDATLIYAQAEKENRNNEVGYEARYKKALLAYYNGNFAWSLSQLKVLKGNTSKLIANDALELSLRIETVLTADSAAEDLKMFARADMLILQKKTRDALFLLDSIVQLFPSGSLVDDCVYKKGMIYMDLKEYEKALNSFLLVVQNYGYDMLADNALYKIAQLYDYQFENKDKAIEYYRQIITDHNSSIYVSSSRARYNALKNPLQ